MIRLIGILVGSAIAVGILIVTLGVPEFSRNEPASTPVGGGLPATEPDFEPVGGGLPATEPDVEPVGGGLPATEPVGGGLPATEPAGGGLPATEPEMTDEQLVEQIFAPQPEPLLDEHWYAFWSPFRSEIAANGFVARLQQTTGMDYRVVKLKPGVYEVAFAYTDQDDIEQKLARISAATGLDMSGG